MAQEKKKYRLVRGTHMVPKPGFQLDIDPTEESHAMAKAGDIVELNDEQFKAFGDKFAPLETGAIDVRDGELAKTEAAKVEAAKTGQIIDPNKPVKPTTLRT